MKGLAAALLLGVLLAGCGRAAAPPPCQPAPCAVAARPRTTATRWPSLTARPSTTASATASPPATASATPVPPATASATPVPPATASATPVPPATATPDPFAPFYIESLAARPYGLAPIEVGALLDEQPTFRRYAFSYLSDGLLVTGYLNLPHGEGPFPVVLLNHGYYLPGHYRQGDGTRPAADLLAAQGFLTLASDYRNHAGSDPGPTPFRTGYVVDVMNLLHALPTLPPGWADPSRVGMWGHSMGGGLTVNAAVLGGERLRAVVIYGAMSGDMADNARHIQAMWQRDEFNGPVAIWGGPDEQPDAYARMSALRYLPRARAAFAIHHGTADEQVPYPWSETLRDAVAAAGLPVEHFAYPAAPHSFRGDDWARFMARTLAFFDSHLRDP